MTRSVGPKDYRARLEGLRGRAWRREIDELCADPGFRSWLRSEHPEHAEGLLDPSGRRDFLRLMGAALAMSGLGACTRQPTELILPWASSPESTLPGKPLFFATSMPLGGAGMGLLVENHMGRPTKVEGNPLHPSSLGSTDALAQASVLDLYDPDRAQVVTERGRISTLSAFLGALRQALEDQRPKRGAGLRVLTETVASPSLAAALRGLSSEYPAFRWHQYEALHRDEARAGARLAFGKDVQPRHALDRADVILALDADFLGRGAARVRHARDMASRRRVREGGSAPCRLYAAETHLSLTGGCADHRLALRPSLIEELARAVAEALGVRLARPTRREALAEHEDWIESVVRDLRAAGARSLVVAGNDQPPAVHALAHAMNATLGCVGTTVDYIDPVEPEPSAQVESLRQLTRDMEAGKVDLLVILGGNPVYDAPSDLELSARLDRVPLRVHVGLFSDETSDRCHWHVPRAHFLESWGDARAHDGTAGLAQPLIAPLYEGLSDHELVAAVAGRAGVSGHDLVREHWRGVRDELDDDGFERWWRRCLHDGVVAGSSSPPKTVALQSGFDSAASRAATSQTGSPELEARFVPDPTVWDGRFANNAWLQELPKPNTLLTWDNPALIAPATAERLGLESGRVVELALLGRTLEIPVWVSPGHAEDCLTLPLGYGRRHAGRVAEGAGFDTYRLRSSDAMHAASGLTLRDLGRRHLLATTQEHGRMEGRDPARVLNIAALARGAEPGAAEAGAPDHGTGDDHAAAGEGHGGGGEHGHATLLAPLETDNRQRGEGHAWGMVIDLGACTGCNACTIACQAENSVPVVGKEEVARGREMHWIRVDRYWTGDESDPGVVHQPVPCMHCERAPCEVVCPVAATVHSDEGLNEMVYNRCVGTRYCANNCPYKVRRFNFYHYTDDAEPLSLQRNPDVTVRSRGVMEKCTYCVQRINRARIEAKVEGRPIAAGEVVTACQQVCPAQAISFGDLNDPESEVSRLRHERQHYGLLEELNTRPRTTYLASVRDPSPELEGSGG